MKLSELVLLLQKAIINTGDRDVVVAYTEYDHFGFPDTVEKEIHDIVYYESMGYWYIRAEK